MGEPEGEELGDDMDLFGPMADDDDSADGDKDVRDDDAQRTEHGVPAERVQPHPEGRDPKLLRNPVKPSAEDIEKHNVTHLPYRSWCEVCAKAVGREDPHYRKSASERERGGGLPRISLDYQELLSVPKKNPKPEDNVVKIIVAKDEESGAVLAYRVTTKGPGDTWMIKRLVKDIEEMGRQDIVLKTDGEPAMIALQSAVQAARGGRTVLENPLSTIPKATAPARRPCRTWTARLGSSRSRLRPGWEWRSRRSRMRCSG